MDFLSRRDTEQKSPAPLTSARSFQVQSRLHGALGVIGLASAAVLIYPKALALRAGNLHVLGVGTIANLALVSGSLTFLRNARSFRAQAAELQRPDV